MKNFQTATSLSDFEEMAAKTKNMVDGEVIVLRAAAFAGDSSSEWKREFCAKHLGRFHFTRMYKILMGTEIGTRQYHYVPNPF
jgi:hypothetical protein